MRILQANKFFYHRGGTEAVFFDTIDGLRKRGHEVAEFSMHHPNNLPSDYDQYFASALPELTGEKLSSKDKMKIFARAISSSEIQQKLGQLAADFKPEAAHLHNVTRQLSGSIFTTLKKLKIPIALTVHDVQPMCPNHRMVRGDSRICESCYQHKYYHCWRYRCVDSSAVKSFGAMMEAYYYYWRGIWDLADIFICPSEFMKDKMRAWGFAENKMRLVRNPFSVLSTVPPLGNKIVYLGRLHEEKGVRTFLEALPQLRQYEVIIAGSGPEDARVDKYIKERWLTNAKKVGWVKGASREKVWEEAKVVVVPSLFYENCSITILEAMALGKIVVASNRGGNPELVFDGATGFLAEPENPRSLARVITKAMELPLGEAEQIGERARQWVAQHHHPQNYFDKLDSIYEELIA